MATIAVANESEASYSRVTIDGRKLTYELRVLQQPQRARACGSGAKSSADRRPVDPPPVIELKVFEGEQKQDITFTHKANFFVYTTLEAARHIAHARGQPISQPPVLTGSPVSGAALLDRPSPAAYFIFPDLSVRHEGRYRLVFTLFEELKESKDEDASTGARDRTHALLGSSPMASQAHVHSRLEVRSQPFQVFSAKRFPGLTESTSLSRVVAEQGCRVRIRRDIRMRRRETGKAAKDAASDRDDCNAYSVYNEPLSATDAYRQPSIEQQTPSVEHSYYSSYQTPTYSQPPATNYAQHVGPPSQPQYQPCTTGMEQRVAQNNGYAQSYNQYQPQQQQQQQPQPQHTRHPSLTSNHNSCMQQAYHPQQQQQQTPDHASYPPSDRISWHEATLNGIGFSAKSEHYADQAAAAKALSIDNTYQQQQKQQQPQSLYSTLDPRAPTPAAEVPLPPLKTAQSTAATKLAIDTSVSSIKPEVSISNGNSFGYEGGSAAGVYMPTIDASTVVSSIRAGTKRGYDGVFDAGGMGGNSMHGGLSNGARNELAGQDVPQIETDEGLVDVEDLLSMKMLTYRRANGHMQTRKVPSPQEA